MKTTIVYKFNCKNCPATYIGESKWALKDRINGHKNKKSSESVVCEHKLEFNHEFYWENTKIVDYVSDGKWKRRKNVNRNVGENNDKKRTDVPKK